MSATIVAVARDGALPVSYSQRRMWLVQRFNPETTAYNMPFAVRLRGTLDRRALEQTLAQLVERHEAFRTSFVEAGGEPMQTIAARGNAALSVIAIEGESEEARREQAARTLTRLATETFDLNQAPLHRLSLLRLDEHDHVLLWLIHHAIGDMWSATLLLREFAQLYNAAVRGAVATLPTLDIEYADYAHWQRKVFDQALLADQLAYWRERLAGPGLPAVWVLELSSFQLDGVQGFEPTASTVLNLTEDHLDRHGTMEAYAAIKERLVEASHVAVVGVDGSVKDAGADFPPARLNEFRREIAEGFRSVGDRLVALEAAATARAGERARSAAKGADFEDLLRLAEGGLHAMTGPRFYGWVIGGSHPVGVAAVEVDRRPLLEVVGDGGGHRLEREAAVLAGHRHVGGVEDRDDVLADLAQRMLFIADFTDRRATFDVHAADFTGAQPQLGVTAFARQQLDRSASGSCDLGTLARQHFDAVNG